MYKVTVYRVLVQSLVARGVILTVARSLWLKVQSHGASVQRKGTRPITGFTPDFVTLARIYAVFFSVPALHYTHTHIYLYRVIYCCILLVLCILYIYY